MSQAYTPGLKVSRRVHHRCHRVLPLAGDVVAKKGMRVAARDVVAQTFLPGPITPVNVANLLSVPAGEVPGCMLKKVGDEVAPGEPLARSKGIFGWFQSECPSPAGGTIESISELTGQVMLRGPAQPVELRAYLAGIVVEVHPAEGVEIEADVTLIQGIFGVGGEAYGKLVMACTAPEQELTPDRIRPEHRGAIVVGGARVTADAIARAVRTGAAALVTGGIDDRDLRDFLGYDLGVAITGSEEIGLTLVITEGFGDIAMAQRTFDLLASRAGADAAVNGATQIRAGVLRPEVIVPWGAIEAEAQPAATGTDGQALPPGILAEGETVRIIRDPWFGMIGVVRRLPSEPQVLASGSKARVLEVELRGGERVLVPRANVELIED